jgi:hypothetical protein
MYWSRYMTNGVREPRNWYLPERLWPLSLSFERDLLEERIPASD